MSQVPWRLWLFCGCLQEAGAALGAQVAFLHRIHWSQEKSVHGAKLSTYRGGSREGSWVHAKMMPLFLGHYLAIQKGRTIKARKQPQRALGPVESPPGHPGLSSLIPSLPQASVCLRSPYLRWKRSQRTGMKDLCVEVVCLLTGVHSAKSRLPDVSDPSSARTTVRVLCIAGRCPPKEHLQ